MRTSRKKSSILNPQVQGFRKAAQRLAADNAQRSYKLLTIFVDVFEGYFRHLTQILVETELMPEHDFLAAGGWAHRRLSAGIRNGSTSIGATTCLRPTHDPFIA